MIKLVVVTAILSLTPFATAELKPADVNMDAVNKAHANIANPKQNEEEALGHSDKQTWTKDQTKQADLEKQYKATIASNPENKKTYTYLAGLYLSNNMSTKAVKAYQEAIIHDPINPKLFAAISIAYLHKAKYGMAKAMADEALRLDPSLKGVEKINEYVETKQQAINAASKKPADSVTGSTSMFSGKGLHGSMMPTAMGAKPSDKIHTPN